MDALFARRHPGSRARRPAAAALLAFVALGLLSARALAADAPVTIQNSEFSPQTVTVNVGDTVTWTNMDAVPHTATADDDSWDTGNLAQNGSGDVTFEEAGTFAYHCEIHPSMTGTVVVEAAAAATAAPNVSPPPTDAVTPEPAGSAGWVGALAALLAAGVLAFGFAIRRAARQG